MVSSQRGCTTPCDCINQAWPLEMIHHIIGVLIYLILCSFQVMTSLLDVINCKRCAPAQQALKTWWKTSGNCSP